MIGKNKANLNHFKFHYINSFSGKKFKVIIRAFAICISAFILSTSFSQDTESSFQNVIKKLHTFLKGEIREVIYVHTNGSVYAPGDTIWFKAYNLRSGQLNPSILGAFLNISLYDSNGEQIFTGKYNLNNGTANGQIELSDSLKDGRYFLIAGSNFTIANSPNDIFKKELVVKKIQREEVVVKISIPDTIYSELNLIQGELEVIGEKNTKLSQVKIKLHLQQGQDILKKDIVNTGKSGTGKFDILIPQKLGNDAVFLNAQIKHEGLSGELTVNIPVETIPPTIRFFPEGGQLVEGINSKIAFEAIDVEGNPFDFNGIITDSGGKVITKINTKVLGMGSATIVPQKDERLYLQIIKPKGYKYKYDLPQPVSKGFSLQIIENSSNNITLKVESNACAENDSVSILMLVRNKIWHTKTAKLQDLNHFSIPVNNMPMGVAKITVFNSKGIPQAERLVFLNEDKKLYIKHGKFKDVYEKKEIVDLNVFVQNSSHKATPGLFSVSVSPVYSGNDINWSDNIMTSLLISDDLKGDIPAKGFYFSEKPNSKEALDLLMLTHGWRKFTWENINSSNKYDLNKGIALAGKVTFKNGKPVKNGDITLMNIKTFQAITTTTNEDGKFSFNSNDYLSMLDADKLTLTATSKGGSKKVVVKIDNTTTDKWLAEFSQTSKYKKAKSLNTNELESTKADTTNSFARTYYSNISKRNFWIDDVEVSAKRRIVIPPEVYEKQYMFYEKDEDQIHINLGYNQQAGIIQLLHEVAGSFNVVDGGKILFRGYNSLYPESMQGALFVVNGRLVGFSCNDVDYLNSNDIKNIKVTKSSAAGLRYSSYATGGLIEITTKSAKFEENPAPNKMEQNVLMISGYNLVKEFYSPVYKNDEEKNKKLDLRTTIYWEPNLIIDDSGKASLKFFNSDIPGEYELRIEGLSKSGIPVYMVKRYMVL